jgi:hypothetical protein
MILSDFTFFKSLAELTLKFFLFIRCHLLDLPHIPIFHSYHRFECAYVIFQLISLTLNRPHHLHPLIIINTQLTDQHLILLLEELEILLKLEPIPDLLLQRPLVLGIRLPQRHPLGLQVVVLLSQGAVLLQVL